MKYDQLAELAFAGLSLLPFPIFLGGYADLAGGVFFFLLGATGVLGWVEQFKSKGKPPARTDADASSPGAAVTR
jgi:hypothetical protein